MTGNNIRAARKQRAMTQQMLGAKASITQTQLSRIENGKAEPHPSTVRKIAKALRVKVEALTAGEAGRC